MSDTPAGQLDHLVVAARTLEDGVAWCEATLGVTPGLSGVAVAEGPAGLTARLGTPRNADLCLAHPPVGGRP